MALTVFVSHKSEDAYPAKHVAQQLASHGIGSYLDVADETLVGDGPELGDYLRRRLAECQQLLAVVSAVTQHSWWVPWEIGVATERNYRIATFLTQDVRTPSYLQKWPYLRNDRDIALYAQTCKEFEADLVAKSQTGRILESLRASTARDFHKVLKRRLGQ